MGENICKQCEWQEISLQTVQTAHVAPRRKNKRPNQETGRSSKQTLLQRRRTGGQEAHEKMLNVTNY